MRFGVFYRTATLSHSFHFCYPHALAFVRGIYHLYYHLHGRRSVLHFLHKEIKLSKHGVMPLSTTILSRYCINYAWIQWFQQQRH